MDYTKQWACQSCTFINEKSLDKCTICAATKPKAIMPQKGAVPKAGQLVPAFGALPVTKLSPTVRPIKSFCAATDALALREAMGGIGTDEKVIIHILGHRIWPSAWLSRTHIRMWHRNVICLTIWSRRQ
eukprot:1060723_1